MSNIYFFLLITVLLGVYNHSNVLSQNNNDQEIKVIMSTFLGNNGRNYYGNNPPSKLTIIWKSYLGQGETVVKRSEGTKTWAGAGWTGEPLIIQENDSLYLIQGAYDHKLKKISANSGRKVWEYQYDDVIKGTGTFWINSHSSIPEEKYVILQGSRLGVKNTMSTPVIPSYRAISYISGKELWRLNVKRTECYSRDVDGSALVLNDTAYIGLENGIFTVFNPDYHMANLKDGILQPAIIEEHNLYNPIDVKLHENNIVTESSPALLNDHIYITAGSGHLYGYNLKTREIDWDLYVGSDIDGSPVVTSDNCIIFTIEKQYIKGDGGVMKVDPSKKPEESVVWFFPTQSITFALWEGGVIGSATITDYYNKTGKDNLAAFTAIDGYLYVVNHQKIKLVELVTGPDGKTKYPKPELVFKYKTGSAISTPILVENRLIAAGYDGIYLFSFDENNNFELLDKVKNISFESSPSVYNGKIFIASRNGYLYCFGDK